MNKKYLLIFLTLICLLSIIFSSCYASKEKTFQSDQHSETTASKEETETTTSPETTVDIPSEESIAALEMPEPDPVPRDTQPTAPSATEPSETEPPETEYNGLGLSSNETPPLPMP